MAGEVARVCGAARGRRLPAVRRRTPGELWRLERDDFIDRNLDRPRDLLTANLLRLRRPPAAFRPAAAARSTSSSATRGPGGSSPSRPCTRASPRTRRSPSTRSSPISTRSPASTSRGAASTRCRGRWPAPPRSTACSIRYGTTVDPGGDAPAAGRPAWCTADGERIPADAVVLNPDLPVAYRDLLPGRRRPRRAGCATRRPAWCCTSARARVRADRPPQHPLRPVLAGHLRRGDPTRAG